LIPLRNSGSTSILNPTPGWIVLPKLKASVEETKLSGASYGPELEIRNRINPLIRHSGQAGDS